MNIKASNFIRNFSYALSSNLVSLLVSTLVILVIPKLIGIEEYGYWQLYFFYSSFVGFLHFGWNDGIYLRYGGKEYKDLDKKLFSSQFYLLIIMQFVIAIIIYVTTIILFSDENRMFIIQMTAICMIIMNVRYMLLFILQGTNRIKEYSQITIMDKIFYCGLIIILLLAGVRDYKMLVVSDLVGKFIALLYAVYCCRDIVFHKLSNFYLSFLEAIKNIGVGIKLMFANIASMLIIGVVRFGIEYSWDVTTFGKVSLSLSVSNLMMLFINAVGLIMFPILRRTKEGKLPIIYVTLRDFLMIVLLGVLIFYFPLKVILTAWLPNYTESFIYMALIFPMCVFEGKMALLINTYLKTLRKEKLLLKINLITLLLSLIITTIVTLVLFNLNLAVISIVLLLAFRAVLAEFFLSKILGISVYKDILLELVITLIFILVAWFVETWVGAAIYIVAYMVYMSIKRNDLFKTIKNLKLFLKA
ncbi:hypothetical protein ACQCVO_16420 [Bacillus infantis]|uniref:hypothetical protein n=1 Tax=Bacillus infantis TaxID=324767 RepID=UPI003CEB5676